MPFPIISLCLVSLNGLFAKKQLLHILLFILSTVVFPCFYSLFIKEKNVRLHPV